MKIPAGQIENLMRSVPQTIKAALLYGPDAGLAEERALTIATQITGTNPDPFSLADISPEKIKEDTGAVIAELGSISFFGGRKLVRIKYATDTVSSTIMSALQFMDEGKAGDSFLLVTASELGPRSSLRLLFEKEKNALAIPCYQEDAGSLATTIQAKLRTSGFTWEDGVIEILAARLVGDRMVLNSELEKLFIFKGEDSQISLADIEILLADSAEASLDELCLSVADRDPAKLFRLFAKSISQGIEPVRIIRQLLGYFNRINIVYAKVRNRQPEQEAIASLKPAIFWKNLPHFRRHLGFWAKSGNKLDQVVEILLRAELDCKRTATPELICADSLLKICRVR